ncbi:uroporphyrinogen-III C-methyltransferase [Alteromonas gilva]|uniref:uroporphyrinogen-III C-methyltransferase n=1 Tax=Alteromonas gilva TaxID=2987522 RepID=A0ABT5L504_9ALTE|nr:uroporphyrinogen-III C-methyltransferase [Alteromonas gilva]MDC8831471.1 uroporphyrinogen-III C-methyltransferase [Alteromonas gilva]
MNVRLHAVSSALLHGLLRFQSAFTGRNKRTSIGFDQASAEADSSQRTGEVFIVGAGPGDAELLTMKAYRLLQTADVVLFDWLVDQSVLDCIPRHVSKEFVGKRCGKHSMPQDMICQRLVELGLSGKRVVRLKGGDPAIFARTSEETDALHKAGIPFAIVPGITAASGASAYTGIPLTDRRFAQAVKFMTAQFQNPEKEADWAAIARTAARETTVVYMGLKRLQQLSKRLLAEGGDSQLPVAVIENACCNQQKVVAGTVSNIYQHVADAAIAGPALVIIGQVVTARQPISVDLLHHSYAKSAL